MLKIEYIEYISVKQHIGEPLGYAIKKDIVLKKKIKKIRSLDPTRISEADYKGIFFLIGYTLEKINYKKTFFKQRDWKNMLIKYLNDYSKLIDLGS